MFAAVMRSERAELPIVAGRGPAQGVQQQSEGGVGGAIIQHPDATRNYRSSSDAVAGVGVAPPLEVPDGSWRLGTGPVLPRSEIGGVRSR
jgi:hypothetical protein